jgi:hypothetical protein
MRLVVVAVLLSCACTAPPEETQVGVLDGEELVDFVRPSRLVGSLVDDCEPELLRAGACVPGAGTFGAQAIDFANPKVIATLLPSQQAPFERRLSFLLTTSPTLRPSQSLTASLFVEVVFGFDTQIEGRTFTCEEADPFAIDDADVLVRDVVVINKDLHQLQMVYKPPRNQLGGLASNFGAAVGVAGATPCSIRFDEFPTDAGGRMRGSFTASFVDKEGAPTVDVTDGLFDVQLTPEVP